MDPDEVPTIKGNKGILDYCHELGAVGVTAWCVRMAVERRSIWPHQMANQNWFSRAEVHRWLKSLQQPEPTRYVGANTGRNPNSAGVQ